MQRGQPTTRLSIEDNPMYKRGYEAGFAAGQRASPEKGTQQQIIRPNGQPFSIEQQITRPNGQPFSVEQQITRPNGQPFSPGISNRRSQSQDNKDMKGFRKADRSTVEPRPIQTNKPIKTSRLSNEFQSQRSVDKPTITRNVRLPNREHEMAGKTTNPETEVQFNAQGHY